MDAWLMLGRRLQSGLLGFGGSPAGRRGVLLRVSALLFSIAQLFAFHGCTGRRFRSGGLVGGAQSFLGGFLLLRFAGTLRGACAFCL